MKRYKTGFLGAGNMGEAIVNGMIAAQLCKNDDICMYDTNQLRLIHMVDHYAVSFAKSVEELIRFNDIIVLAVKPNVCDAVLAQMGEFPKDKAIFSIVAGRKTQSYLSVLGADTHFLRIMPNTPVMCGCGMSVLSSENTLTAEQMEYAKTLFGTIGEVEILEEKYFDVVTALSGSGPAYVFMFIEAMVQAGIRGGLTAKVATKLAAQTVLGAAEMILVSDSHPAQLRDAVCSPGGTTIEAVSVLEEERLTGVIMRAIDRCMARSRQLSEGDL